MTPEIRLLMECGFERFDAENLLVAVDFSGWVLVKKSALHSLCEAAGVDYDEFEPAAPKGTHG